MSQRRGLPRLMRLGGWSLADQVLSSATNFGTGIVVARLLGPAPYGSFALAFAAYLVVLGLTRSFLTQPYLVATSALKLTDWKESTKSSAGATALLGFASGLLAVAAGLVLGLQTSTGRTFVVLGALAAPLVLQDFWRFAGFSRAQPRAAFVNDLIWALTQAMTLIVLWMIDALSPETALMAWGLGALSGSLVGGWQFRLRPQLGRGAFKWIRGIASMGSWFTLSSAIYAAGTQAVLAILAGSAGRSSVGGLRSAMMLLGAPQLVSIAAESVALPEVVRRHKDAGVSGSRRFIFRYALLLVATLGLFGLGLALFREQIMGLVFGPEFLPFAAVLLPLGIGYTVGLPGVAAGVGIRALAAGRRLSAVQAVSTATKVATVLVLAPPLGVVGAAWGLASASLVYSVLQIASYARLTTPERREVPGGATALAPEENVPV